MEQSPFRKANRFSSVKKFPSFHLILKIITALTDTHHLSLFWVISTQSMLPFHFLKINLILFSYLRPGLPSGLFPSDFPTKIRHASLLSPTNAVRLFWPSVPNADRMSSLVMVTFARPKTSFLRTDYFDTGQSFSMGSSSESLSTITNYAYALYLFEETLPQIHRFIVTISQAGQPCN